MDDSLDFWMFLNHWAFVPEIWIIMGIILILADVLIGLSYILIPFGIACFITSGLVAINNSDYLYSLSHSNEFVYNYLNLESWQDILYWYAALSIISVFLLRFITRGRPEKPDINQY
jgi:membrane-bound ClpP family serine protease